MLNSVPSIGRFARVVVPLIVGSTAMAQFCEPGDDINYKNATDEPLFVSVNGGGRDKLPPRHETGYGYINTSDETLSIVITDDNGCVVWTRKTTLKELRGEDLTITIAPDMLPPRDKRADCNGGS